ncbi:MAG: redoxin domain-containing protein [Akkermansiaceae bacterium]
MPNPPQPHLTMKSILFASLAGAIALATVNAKEVGKAAPAFAAKNLKGETVSLADHAGKVVVLEWANFSCPFVKKHYQGGNMPKLQADYAAKGVVWLTINSGAEGKQGYHEPSKMAEVAAAHKNQATHFIMDTDGTVGKAYDAKVTPHLFIINADGVLAYNGAIDSKATTNSADVETADKYFVKALDAVLAGNEVENATNKPYGCGVKY